MGSNATMSEVRLRQLRDLVIQTLWYKGQICAPDLFTQLIGKIRTTPTELLEVMNGLEREGVLRRANPECQIENDLQKAFELAVLEANSPTG